MCFSKMKKVRELVYLQSDSVLTLVIWKQKFQRLGNAYAQVAMLGKHLEVRFPTKQREWSMGLFRLEEDEFILRLDSSSHGFQILTELE